MRDITLYSRYRWRQEGKPKNFGDYEKRAILQRKHPEADIMFFEGHILVGKLKRSVTEIVRESGLSKPTVLRVLRDFEKSGYVTSTRRGRQRMIMVNEPYALLTKCWALLIKWWERLTRRAAEKGKKRVGITLEEMVELGKAFFERYEDKITLGKRYTLPGDALRRHALLEALKVLNRPRFMTSGAPERIVGPRTRQSSSFKPKE